MQWKYPFSSLEKRDSHYRATDNSEKPMYTIYLTLDKPKDISRLNVMGEMPLYGCMMK